MAEDMYIPEVAEKDDRYRSLIPQIKALVTGEPNLVANLANTVAALKEMMGFLWVGFYLVDGDELVLGPFQGPVACTRISKGKGVCGTAWSEARTVLVDDVDAFPGHIACSSLSRSEIVVPVFQDGQVTMIIDVDSSDLAAFDEVDRTHLESIATLIASLPAT